MAIVHYSNSRFEFFSRIRIPKAIDNHSAQTYNGMVSRGVAPAKGGTGCRHSQGSPLALGTCTLSCTCRSVSDQRDRLSREGLFFFA